MKKYLKPLLWICVILFVCVLLIPVFDDEEYVYSIDHDTYIYRDDVMVTLFEGQDTLEIDVDPSRRKENWRWLREHSIPRDKIDEYPTRVQLSLYCQKKSKKDDC